jgi:prophage antirepressor-like protein
MTAGGVVPLDFEGRNVRMVERDDAQWWVLADVCRAMDIANPSVVAARLDDDEKGVATTETLGGLQSMTIITEPGLYAVILQSRKPIARRFDRWVRHVVLPTIRKTGHYATQFDGAVILQQIDRRLATIEHLTRAKRRTPSDADRRTAGRFARLHGGSCPCCRRCDVVDAAGNIINNAQIDHFFQVDRMSLKTSWLICGECHHKLTSGLMPREMCVGRFKAYQELLAEWLSEDTGPLFSIDPTPAPAPSTEPVIVPEQRAVAQPAKISLLTEIEIRQGRLF